MTRVNSVIRVDGDTVAYAFMDPYEVGCVDRVQDRVSGILSKTPIAVPTHEPVDTPIDLPRPPRVEPISPRNRVMEFILELDRTTNVSIEELSGDLDAVRETPGIQEIESDAVLPTDDALYSTIADLISRVTDHVEVDETELQREIEDSVKAQSLSAVITAKEAKYLDDEDSPSDTTA